MIYGEKDGAIGYLVGEANSGLEYMFIMMNAARLAWGWRASPSPTAPTSWRVDYAKERVQGRRSAADAARARSSGTPTCAAC